MKQQRASSNQTCTCKLLPWSLSSNTAAEFGDLGSLAARIAKTSKNESIQQPLHLAAQHGHIGVTSYLLENGFHPDSGKYCDPNIDENSPTPLHRACFSGAIGCMKLLLDKGADLLQKDFSFGDGMTPMHKAVKGGRYFAVAIIIQYCQQQNSLSGSSLLDKVLNAVDGSNLTPLALAYEMNAKGEDEILSLRRWDVVADGPANFQKCIDIIENLNFEYSGKSNRENIDHKAGVYVSSSPFCECKDDDDGTCRTQIWEQAFTNALRQSTESIVGAAGKNSSRMADDDPMMDNKQSTASIDAKCNVDIKTERESKSKETLGQPCEKCGTPCIALFRSRKKELLCKKCFWKEK